jgi:hypothetical protein
MAELPLSIPAPPTNPSERFRWAILDGLVVARRNLAQIRYIPEKLTDVTIQPTLFVILFGNPEAPTTGSPWPRRHAMEILILWSLLFIAVFMQLSVRNYLRATSR